MRESSRNRTRMTNSSGARTAPTHVHSERQVRHPQRRVSTVDFRIGHDARATEHQSRFLSFLKSLLRDFITSVHAGRITKTVRSRRLKEAKNPSNCFHGKYFLLSNCIPRAASSPVTISARASTHSPSTLPRMSHGAILTRGLFRTRFTFPETPMVYTYSFASLESRFTAGSAANHTGVFTPSPLILNVSRFRYLCPSNCANPIASLPPLGCASFYTGHKHKGQAICRPALWSAATQLPVSSPSRGTICARRKTKRSALTSSERMSRLP